MGSRSPSGMPLTRRARSRSTRGSRHNWKEPHYWDYPMLPVGMTEASCSKCHREELRCRRAEHYARVCDLERRRLLRLPQDARVRGLRKPGPNLTRIKAKLSPIGSRTGSVTKCHQAAPGCRRSGTPRTPIRRRTRRATRSEINATVAYLFANSDEFAPLASGAPSGNAAAGKQIVESIGCLGWPVVERRPVAAGPRRTSGSRCRRSKQDLSRWIYDWVRDPRHTARRPTCRTCAHRAQAADVTAYLCRSRRNGTPRRPLRSKGRRRVLFDI